MPYTTRAVPDQNFTLTRVGIDYLKNKSLAGAKGVLTKFRYGDGTNPTIDQELTSNFAGSLVHEGTAAAGEMFFSKFHDHEVIIRCQLKHDIGDFNAGSIAILTDDDIAIFVGKLNYLHGKMASTATKAGGRLTFQFRFIMFDIETHWDFSNLTEHYVELESFDDDMTNTPQRPIYAPTTEQIQTDAAYYFTNRAGYVWIPQVYDHNWSSPSGFNMRLDDADFWNVSGGNDGDGHQYVFS